MGNVVRPSDGKVPKRIAFVQCVGSRDEAHEWCSSVCCMYSLKEAIIAREHEHDVECTLFYMDIRAHGKGFDVYYERAKEMGIRFVRCRPSRIDELESKSLRVGFVPEDGEADAYRTRTSTSWCSRAASSPRRKPGQWLPGSASSWTRTGSAPRPRSTPWPRAGPGVFLAGPFSEPKDIPETVVEASSAAAEAMTLLAERRGTLVTKVELPPETDIAGQVPRIGVFVCHCGKNIGAYVDVPAVREYARTLPFVVFAMDNLYTCSSDTQVIIKSKIAEHRLNRVVVASCSPRTHEPLFQQTIREQGLNVHLFEMANIRDQCSWVHMELKREATEKSKDLVRMAVAKSRLTEPLHAQTLPVTRAALVVGGGAAGMSAALTLADQGYDTFLVEKSPRLGGVAAGIERNLAGHGIADHVAGLVRRVASHPRLTVFTDSHLERVEGFVGNFETTIAPNSSNGRHGPAREPVKVKHGAVILAVGAGESRPAEYLYGKHPAVVTLLELERRMAGGGGALPPGAAAGTVVFIQCVGSRERDHLYCSRTCCAAAIKQAIRIKEQSPDTNVLVIYRDIRTYGFRETAYERARELGVAFIRYDLDQQAGGRAARQGRPGRRHGDGAGSHPRSRPGHPRGPARPLGPGGREPRQRAAVAALQGAAERERLLPRGARQAAARGLRDRGRVRLRLRALPQGHDRGHRPGEGGRGPGRHRAGPRVDRGGGQDLVRAREPVRGVRRLRRGLPVPRGGDRPGAEQGDGERRAVQGLRHLRGHLPQRRHRPEGLPRRADHGRAEDGGDIPMSEAWEPKIVAFLCNWCSYAGADLAGVSRMQYPPNIRVVRVPCSGRINPLFILAALQNGADGVLVSGCHPGDCHYLSGNLVARRKFNTIKDLLAYVGIEPGRVQFSWVSASEGGRFSDLVRQVSEDVKRLGPQRRLAKEPA